MTSASDNSSVGALREDNAVEAKQEASTSTAAPLAATDSVSPPEPAAPFRPAGSKKSAPPRPLRRVAPPLPVLIPAAQSSPAMDKAAEFLARALAQAAAGERRIILFGDFDVDGTTSASILYLFSKLCGIRDVVPYVSRRKDGYGLTKGALARLLPETPDPSRAIVVMMDLGVSSTSECELLLQHGYSTMVIDHHVPSRTAKAEWQRLTEKYGKDRLHVYDPLLCSEDIDRQFKVLSAAGLVFKLCQRIRENNFSALREKIEAKDKFEIHSSARPQPREMVLNTMVKLCAIAQAADCMPFAENGQVTAAWHLAKEFESPGALLAGVKVLYERTNTASRIGWVIGPVINAIGRLMEDPYAAFELLTEVDEEQARKRLTAAEEIRKRVQTMTKNAQLSLDQAILTSRGVAALLADPTEMSGGVVGIAAARAADHFKAPAVYFSAEEGEDGLIFKGSMRRGPTNFSCEEWVLALKEQGIAYAGGGHPAAAGIAVKEDKLEALVASAEKQTFLLEEPPIYEVTVEAALEYASKIKQVLPFGRGHESAILAIKGLLTRVERLPRLETKPIWCYSLTIADFESSKPIEVKVMANEIDEETTKTFNQIVGKSLSFAVEVRAIVHDSGEKDNPRFARSDLRAYATADEVKPQDTESGRRAQLRFISKAEFEEFQRHERKLTDELLARAKAEAALVVPSPLEVLAKHRKTDSLLKSNHDQRPQDGQSEKPLGTSPLTAGTATGGTAEPLLSALDPLRASEGLLPDLPGEDSFRLDEGGLSHEEIVAAAGQSEVLAHVDWNDSLHRRVFMLRCPSKFQLTETLGEKGFKVFDAMHGGSWNQQLKCYMISSGVIEHLLNNHSSAWKFIFSSKALEHWDDLKREFSEVAAKKADSTPFVIPFLKPGRLSPLGFQYADVRLYLERSVALCNNAMGTGKTFEGGIIGALRYKGAVLDENRQPVIPPNAKERRVLFVTLKSVLGQFANELEENFDVKVARVTTQSIREVLLNVGEITKKTKKSPRNTASNTASHTVKSPKADSEDGDYALEEASIKEEKVSKEGEQEVGGSEEGSDEGSSKADDKKIKPIYKISAKAKRAFETSELKGKHYVITTYECLARNPWLVSSFEWGGVIIDEAQEIKGEAALKTKAILGVELDGAPLRHGDYRAPILALSGTFTKNRPSDWFPWVRLTGADGGIYSEGPLAQSKNRFDMRFDGLYFDLIKLRGGRKQSVRKKRQAENGDELRRILAPFVVRRLITEIKDMPPFKAEVQPVASSGLYLDVISKLTGAGEMSAESRELLQHHKLLGKGGEILSEGGLAKEDEEEYSKEIKKEIKEVDASLAGKLAMISSLDKAAGVLSALEERGWLTPNSQGEIEPFVIMTFHRCAGREVSRQLAKAGISHHLMTQNDNAAQREEKKNAFQNGEKTCFVTSLGVGGTGISLFRASRMMIVNLPWTDTALAQGISRIFRLGQKRATEVAILLLLGSVDHGVYEVLKSKGSANIKTLGLDKMREGEIPAWATGSVMDNAKFAKSDVPRRRGRTRAVKYGDSPAPSNRPGEANEKNREPAAAREEKPRPPTSGFYRR